MKKKMSEILKELEQMHRDKRSLDEIHTATMRHREFAEAEEDLEANTPKPPVKVNMNFGRKFGSPI